MKNTAIVGAGVSGLTCAVLLAEHGYPVRIFADETGPHTTSAAAGAIWYPYDVEPFDTAILCALETYQVFQKLAGDLATGVSMIELKNFSRTGTIQIPGWAQKLGARLLDFSGATIDRERSSPISPGTFSSGFTIMVPLIDTTIYLDYLASRFIANGGSMNQGVHFQNLEQVPRDFDLIVNCSGIGAKQLVPDPDVEPHRGQVAIVPKLNLRCAIVCDEPPLMYAIPRRNDCLFGGTNSHSDNRDADPGTTEQIVNECSRVLGIDHPSIVESRVGLRPFRHSGICLEAVHLNDGRAAIHHYGHGGAGFTLSWGCAQAVLRLANQSG